MATKRRTGGWKYNDNFRGALCGHSRFLPLRIRSLQERPDPDAEIRSRLQRKGCKLWYVKRTSVRPEIIEPASERASRVDDKNFGSLCHRVAAPGTSREGRQARRHAGTQARRHAGKQASERGSVRATKRPERKRSQSTIMIYSSNQLSEGLCCLFDQSFDGPLVCSSGKPPPELACLSASQPAS